MIKRNIYDEIVTLMQEFPAVGLLSPRQVGKTMLAETIAALFSPVPIYLDLEKHLDQAKLSDPEYYFERNNGKLIILDEIQRVPELLQVLRGVIDRRRRQGLKTAQYFILGFASLDL